MDIDDTFLMLSVLAAAVTIVTICGCVLRDGRGSSASRAEWQRAALEAAARARLMNDQVAGTPPRTHTPVTRIRAHSADHDGYLPPPVV